MNQLIGLACLVADLKIIIRNEISRHGLDPDLFKMDAMLNPCEVRNGLIRARYKELRKERPAMECYEILAECGLTEKTIEDIVYNRR